MKAIDVGKTVAIDAGKTLVGKSAKKLSAPKSHVGNVGKFHQKKLLKSKRSYGQVC